MDMLDTYNEIKQLSKENPEEYVRRFFENSRHWEDYAYDLYSDHVREALAKYLSSKVNRHIYLYRLVDIVKHNKQEGEQGEIEEWMQEMADDFTGLTVISDFLFNLLDQWAHDEGSQELSISQTMINSYFDYIGNNIYKENKRPSVYVTELSKWRKSINAKAHVEILIRYFNDRLADENEYQCWANKLPKLFEFKYHDFHIQCTGIYTLFFKQMLSPDDMKPFVFTPLSRQTKRLIALCSYECRWDYKPRSFRITESMYANLLFFEVSDMVLSEKLYEYGGKNFGNMLMQWLLIRNPQDLKEYINRGEHRFVYPLFNALKTFFKKADFEIDNPWAKKHVAQLILQYPPNFTPYAEDQDEETQFNAFEKIDYHEWIDLWEKANEIIERSK